MSRLPLFSALTLVGVLRWIVPRRHRRRWLAEWRGELHHRARHADADVLARSFSAIPHATTLARHEWSPGVLMQDLRYALRRLAASPGFVVVAILTVAIGIGANVAIFTVINSTLINPLPFPEADRMVYIWRVSRNGQMAVTPNAEDLQLWRDRVKAFDALHIYSAAPVTYTGGDEPSELIGMWVTHDFLPFLGVEPARGRGFSAEEVTTDAKVALVSDGFWRTQLGGRDDVIGAPIILDGETHDIIGVLPRGFVFQAPFENTPVWVPLPPTMLEELRSPFSLARLQPGVGIEAADAELKAVAAAADAEKSQFYRDFPPQARSPNEMFGDSFKTSMIALQVAVALVLLIACANVANLLLARGAAQQRELAVRAAIGAGRGRLLRQLLTENLLLAGGGGVLGYAFASMGVRALMALKPESMANLDTVRVDPSMMALAVGIAAVTGIVFGLVPALHSSRPDVLAQIKDATRSGSPSGRRAWLRNGLVVAEVALSIILLVGAGLILNSLGRLLTYDIGFDPANVVAIDFSLPEERYPEEAGRVEFYRQLDERLRRVAGDRLEAIAHVSSPPGRMGIWFGTFGPEGEPPPPEFQEALAFHNVVSPEFFDVLRLPLVRGRGFVAGDVDDARNPVVINAEWARRMWGDLDVVGRRFKDVDDEDSEYRTVVGVIDDARLGGRARRVDTIQVLTPRNPTSRHATLLIRLTEDPLLLVDELKRQVWALDPDVPIKEARPVEDIMSETLAPQRFNATLVSLAAGMALVLALVGLYGVLSYAVSRRTREIGIRMALGAETGSLVPMVVAQGMKLVGAGVVVGLAGALALTRFIESLLFGVTPSDVTTYAVVALLLGGVSLAACLLPAARAARLDPLVALRSE